ncbi:hypothetical protein AOLI_G00166470 [Acnodon oligacanthus]
MQRKREANSLFLIIVREMEEPSTLVDFFRERGIAEDLIKRMETDKIDISVIPLMNDSELQQYIPHYGDRLAVISYCLSNQPYQGASQLIESPPSRLFGPREDVSKRHMGNTYAKKKARRVELGWMNYNEKGCNFKQVRTANGGGTKHISINKQAKMSEVRRMAERIFFPAGASRFFYLKDVDCDIRDFSHRRLDENLTVGDLYEAYKVKILRLYLFTKKRSASNVQGPQDLSLEGGSAYMQQENNDFSIAMHSQSLENHLDREAENSHGTQGLEHPYDEAIWEDQIQENGAVVSARWMTELHNQDTVYDVRTIPQTSDVSTSTGNSQFHDYKEYDIGTGAQLVHRLDDTLPFEVNSKVIVEVRRGNCLSDMMGAFTDATIMDKEVSIHMKLPNGGLEVGVGSGVFRDCLSEFWSEFYNRCTLGSDVKAPFLRHEFQVTEWQAIARVLLKGWIAEKYFPIHLPLPFLEETLYGTIFSSVSEAFMLYISKHDREVLQHALNNFETVDQDSLLDILDSYECHRMPTEENLGPLLTQLGHKALIQMPKFVIDCWRPILKELAKTISPQKLTEIIEERVPSPKKVNALLKFPEDMNVQQNTVARHLKRYIRELDDSILQRFLRFCTGADVIFGKHITVQFIEKKDFECRPRANILDNGYHVNRALFFHRSCQLFSLQQQQLSSSVHGSLVFSGKDKGHVVMNGRAWSYWRMPRKLLCQNDALECTLADPGHGLVKAPSLPCYWSSKSLFRSEFPASVMTQARFEAIASCFHLSDPETDAINESKAGTAEYDPLHQLKPLLNDLKTSCKRCFHPFRSLTITQVGAEDEFEKFVLEEPNIEKCRLFVLADNSWGYVWNLCVTENSGASASPKGLGYDSVMELMDMELLGQGYHLCVDSFHTRLELFKDLRQSKCYGWGIISPKALGFPRTGLNYGKVSNNVSVEWLQKDHTLILKYTESAERAVCSTIHRAAQGRRTQRKSKNRNLPSMDKGDVRIQDKGSGMLKRLTFSHRDLQ